MSRKLLFLVLIIVTAIEASEQAYLDDYLRASSIRTAIEPIITASREFNCNEISLSIILLANPSEEINLQSIYVKQRIKDVMRMAKDTALHTRELKYVRLFNACLQNMGVITVPTAQYLMLDDSPGFSDYPEFKDPKVEAYMENPNENPMPEFLHDYIDSTVIQQAIIDNRDQPKEFRCMGLARSLLNQSGQFNPHQPGFTLRLKRVHELALSTAIWTRNWNNMMLFRQCLTSLGVRTLSTHFYLNMNMDTTKIGPISLPQDHTKQVGDTIDLKLD